MFTIRDVVAIAVRIEENGEQIYRDAARAVQRPDLSSLLFWLADEEAQHTKWFEDFGKKLPQQAADPALEAMARTLLHDALGPKAFSLDEAELALAGSMEQLLKAAVEMENDTVLFYEMISGFVEDEKDRTRLGEIIAQEMEHSKKLSGLL
jgi:rubrerythrin